MVGKCCILTSINGHLLNLLSEFICSLHISFVQWTKKTQKKQQHTPKFRIGIEGNTVQLCGCLNSKLPFVHIINTNVSCWKAVVDKPHCYIYLCRPDTFDRVCHHVCICAHLCYFGVFKRRESREKRMKITIKTYTNKKKARILC